MTDRSPEYFALPALERLLIEAATDRGFKEALISRREAAAEDRGIALSASERAALAAMPESQLRVMIDKTPLYDELGAPRREMRVWPRTDLRTLAPRTMSIDPPQTPSR